MLSGPGEASTCTLRTASFALATHATPYPQFAARASLPPPQPSIPQQLVQVPWKAGGPPATTRPLCEPRRVTCCWSNTLLPKHLPAQAHGPMRNGALASQGSQARNAACIPMKPMLMQAGAARPGHRSWGCSPWDPPAVAGDAHNPALIPAIVHLCF